MDGYKRRCVFGNSTRIAIRHWRKCVTSQIADPVSRLCRDLCNAGYPGIITTAVTPVTECETA